MDKIYLKSLKCQSFIGVYAWEKKLRQTLVFDIEAGVDSKAAASTDSLDDALNYKKLADSVVELAESKHFNLIETLAEEVASLIRDEFKVQWVRVTLDKGQAVKGVGNVGVMIERGER